MILENITRSYTEIYVGGGNFITESYPTNFHTFVTSRPLAAGQTADDFREVTAAEREEIERIDARWVRPPQFFIDLWNIICKSAGRYNEATGFFELNGLVDITYKEALEIYRYGQMSNDGTMELKYAYANIRTNLPSRIKYSVKSGARTFLSCDLIEVIDATLLMPGGACFSACYKLREIRNIYSPNNPTLAENNSIWAGCSKLESIKGIQAVYPTSFSMADSPLLNLDTLSRIVMKYNHNTEITITIHPKVYSKLVDETNSEWHRVMLDAAEKNIVFATT